MVLRCFELSLATIHTMGKPVKAFPLVFGMRLGSQALGRSEGQGLGGKLTTVEQGQSLAKTHPLMLVLQAARIASGETPGHLGAFLLSTFRRNCA